MTQAAIFLGAGKAHDYNSAEALLFSRGRLAANDSDCE